MKLPMTPPRSAPPSTPAAIPVAPPPAAAPIRPPTAAPPRPPMAVLGSSWIEAQPVSVKATRITKPNARIAEFRIGPSPGSLASLGSVFLEMAVEDARVGCAPAFRKNPKGRLDRRSRSCAPGSGANTHPAGGKPVGRHKRTGHGRSGSALDEVEHGHGDVARATPFVRAGRWRRVGRGGFGPGRPGAPSGGP